VPDLQEPPSVREVVPDPQEPPSARKALPDLQEPPSTIEFNSDSLERLVGGILSGESTVVSEAATRNVRLVLDTWSKEKLVCEWERLSAMTYSGQSIDFLKSEIAKSFG